MSVEQLLVYLFFAAFALLQFLGRARQRRREREAEHEHGPAPEPNPEEQRRWEQQRETPLPEFRVEALPPPDAPPARAPEPVAPRVRPRPQAQRAPQPARPEAAWQVRIVPGNRAELRRAVALMTIIGPPRSQDPNER